MTYSPYFRMLYDERAPVGSLGRGTHYSVFRAPVWHDAMLTRQESGSVLDFAVLWDEDHDWRIMIVLQEIFFRGALAPIRFIGERKGSLHVILTEDAKAWSTCKLRQYSTRLEDVTKEVGDDSWTVAVGIGTDSVENVGIVNASTERVKLYLSSIQMLWSLGIREAEALAAAPPVRE